MSLNGRLTLEALQHDLIVLGGLIGMVLGVLSIVGIITYKKKWKWLWKDWVTSLDPKKIGVMYIVVAFIMLIRGIMDAAMMRAQQAIASGGDGYLDANHFQQIFSAHGTIMIFFVAMGLMFGLINWIVPLQIGARDVAYPFLNSMSFWLFVAGAVLINISLAIGEFSAAGWLAYPPLSGLEYSPGVGVDYWIWSLQIAGVGSLLSGINFLVTILKMRRPGMTLMKMPIFAWSVLGSMALILFAFPILTATLSLLALDRLMGMHFFTSSFGGNPMLYINMIWAWGHPEVYILILPAFGAFSEIVATFSKKRLFGYTSMVYAIGAITILSFIVWLHHFFTMGAGANVNAFFGIMTMVIAVPTGVKVFNWLFTMFRGNITFASPMMWFMGFVTTFTIGGVTGVMLAVPAIDFQVHNSLFLVAHFHNMVIGGVVFGYMAALTFWFPKIFGYKLHEGLGKAAFWCWLFGFILAFVPLYILGLMGATRRLNTYDASLGWQGLFIVAGVGVLVILAGVGFQVLQLGVSIWQRNKNRDQTGDPWDGRTLEWSTSSPPPEYNFATLDAVKYRDQFWEDKLKGTKSKNRTYSAIQIPKHSSVGFFIGLNSLIVGFAVVWHIWWLAIIGIFGIIGYALVRLTSDQTEFTFSSAEVAKFENHLQKARS